MSKENEYSERANQRLAGRIASMPRPDVPDGILAGVMAGIEPKRRSPWQRFLRRVRRLTGGTTPRAILAGTVTATILVAGVWLATPTQPEPRLALVTQQPQDASGLRLAGSRLARGREVTFVAHMPGAKQVAAIGSFNEWDPTRNIMHRGAAKDVFTLTITLPPGRYVYAFLIDGTTLQADTEALVQEDDGFGNTNSVLIIEDGEDQQHGREPHERPL